MGKLNINICPPGSMNMPTGGHTDGVQKGSHGRGGTLAKPGRSVGKGDSGGRLPLQNPPTNLVGTKIGQPNPDTAAAATSKPKRKGKGAAFFGEY